MFSLSLKIDPNNTIENLPTLGKDMTLTFSADSNPPNTIVLDQFDGNYQHNPEASAKK